MRIGNGSLRSFIEGSVLVMVAFRVEGYLFMGVSLVVRSYLL